MTDLSKLEAFLRIKRAQAAPYQPRVSRADAERGVEALAWDAAAAGSDRAERMARLAREEREASDGLAARRWRARAETLPGFPPRAVADLPKWEATIRSHPTVRFDRMLAAMGCGALIGMRGAHRTLKTTRACLLAREYMPRYGAWAVYAKADDYLHEFRRATQGFNGADQGGWVKAQTARAGLLVLDELDKVAGLYGDNFTAKQTGFWLEAIIDARYAAMTRPTVLIGNFDDRAWEVVPASIRARFKADGVLFSLPVTEPVSGDPR